MCRTCFAHRREWKFITFVKWQNQEGPWDTLHWAACWLFTFLPSCDAEEVFITIRGLFKQTLGDGEGQESLECCSPWFCRIVHDLATEHYPSQHLHLNKPLSQLWQNAAENSQPVFSCGPPPLDINSLSDTRFVNTFSLSAAYFFISLAADHWILVIFLPITLNCRNVLLSLNHI